MRVWLYNQLKNDVDGPLSLGGIIQPKLKVGEVLEDRVSQSETMSDRLSLKPYLFYTIGNATDDQLSENTLTYNQFFQIYVHDTPGDYQLIDRLVVRTKALLQGAHGLHGAYDIMNVRHLETSRDLDDVTLGTIMRYIRFVAKVKEKIDG
jgi:hypothetical protein